MQNFNKIYQDTINKPISEIDDIDNLIKMCFVIINNAKQYKNDTDMINEFKDIKKYLYKKLYGQTNCITE